MLKWRGKKLQNCVVQILLLNFAIKAGKASQYPKRHVRIISTIFSRVISNMYNVSREKNKPFD